MIGDGDGWLFSSDGTRHWGRHGAAGLLLRAPLRTASGSSARVLLQHRAAWSHQGGTWALPGGAKDSHESAVRAAVREAGEEAGIAAAQVIVRAERVTAEADSGWSYTTVVADAGHELDTVPNGESTELRWVAEDEVGSLPLHPGFASSWPMLRATTLRAVVIGRTGPDPGGRTVELPSGGFGWVAAVVSVGTEADARAAGSEPDTVVVSADTSLVGAGMTVLHPSLFG